MLYTRNYIVYSGQEMLTYTSTWFLIVLARNELSPYPCFPCPFVPLITATCSAAVPHL